MSVELQQALARYIDGNGGGDGLFRTAIDGLTLMRASHTSLPNHLIYRPELCVVVQGVKSVMLGDVALDYREMQALVASVELPGVGRVLEATPERPLLVMALELDVPLLIETMRQLPPAPPSGADHGLGLYVVDTRRVADALHMLRCDFARPVRIDELAVTAGMSVSSFHHHFKQLTSMTPLQYQKQLRLLEAKRLMGPRTPT
ncbi:AraC family transcriptional regulator [Duganella levis]|uniref:AraC family transcriptional regulator n=1 Tax=Duganella levis TaxID=2692169 RepID=UPI001928A10C|nr:AraC family transcriptional regulator [Duganella levis]